ncbi:hypothetical protein VP01_980g2 [Puccinia sorghi]|uniref:Uncharacterized protein n=1 Tax=Puccinia sorghi TaxID=27349 RepID=A0A0L6U5R3_9BASI|nr:hypothetical protein VP01_980g2 [Puccinia sorghi]
MHFHDDRLLIYSEYSRTLLMINEYRDNIKSKDSSGLSMKNILTEAMEFLNHSHCLNIKLLLLIKCGIKFTEHVTPLEGLRTFFSYHEALNMLHSNLVTPHEVLPASLGALVRLSTIFQDHGFLGFMSIYNQEYQKLVALLKRGLLLGIFGQVKWVFLVAFNDIVLQGILRQEEIMNIHQTRTGGNVGILPCFPGSFCCYSNLSQKLIQPSFDAHSLCRLHSDCAKISTYANMWSLDGSLAGACCIPMTKAIAFSFVDVKTGKRNVTIKATYNHCLPFWADLCGNWYEAGHLIMGARIACVYINSVGILGQLKFFSNHFLWPGNPGLAVLCFISQIGPGITVPSQGFTIFGL